MITQGVAVATGLQDSFSWTSVAVSAVSAGVGRAVGMNLPDSYSGHQIDFVSGLAGGIAGAATQSALTGTSFGDNLIATLPQVIGNTIGNAVASGLTAARRPGAPASSRAAQQEILEVLPGIQLDQELAFLPSIGQAKVLASLGADGADAALAGLALDESSIAWSGRPAQDDGLAPRFYAARNVVVERWAQPVTATR